jgi:hypothetical protein
MEEIPMKPASMLAAAFVMAASLPLVAQQADTAAKPGPAQSGADNGPWKQVNQPGSAAVASEASAGGAGPGNGSVTASTSPAANGVVAHIQSVPRRLFPVHAELMGKLDSKSAKVGDPVELKTQEAVKTSDGMEIPKGSRIMGHVALVEAHGKGCENAQVAVELDRAELKGGQSLAIRSAIITVTPPPDPSTSAIMRSQDNLGGGVMGNATQVMGGAHNGGLGNGTNTGLTVTGGMLQASSKQTEGLGSAADYGVQAPGTASEQAAASHSVVAVGAAAALAHTTGVSGVLLASDISGRLSGTFSALKQNVHLDGGTRVVVGIASVK